MARRRGFAGSRALLFANGKEIGWATGVRGEESIAYQAIEVCGNIEVEEHEEIAYRVSLNTATVYILNETLRDMGIWPENTEAIPGLEEVTIDIFDKVTNTVRWRVEGAKPERRSFQFDRNSVMTNDLSWVARRLVEV